MPDQPANQGFGPPRPSLGLCTSRVQRACRRPAAPSREAQPLRPGIPIRIPRLDEVRLAADELALRQLLVNLLANALRVSPTTAEATVELAANDHTATVTVSDRGPGIPPDQLERIFERFHTTAPRRSGSSGLGLAIAREIAHRHDGDLHAANRPDGGAAFRPARATPARGSHRRCTRLFLNSNRPRLRSLTPHHHGGAA
jgi:signal transduction histidine kinase